MKMSIYIGIFILKIKYSEYIINGDILAFYQPTGKIITLEFSNGVFITTDEKEY